MSKVRCNNCMEVFDESEITYYHKHLKGEQL